MTIGLTLNISIAEEKEVYLYPRRNWCRSGIEGKPKPSPGEPLFCPHIGFLGAYAPPPPAEEGSRCKALVFTGNTTQIQYTPTSREEYKQLMIGKDILDTVAKTVLFSANYLRRSPSVRAKVKEGNFTLDEYEQQFARVHQDPLFANFVAGADKRKQAHMLSELAAKYSVGACGLMTLVGYFYAKEKYPNLSIHRCGIKGMDGDHTFLLLGNDKPSSWSKNADAVIVDPWAGSYYPAAQYKTYLRNFFSVVMIEEEGSCPFPALTPLEDYHYLVTYTTDSPTQRESL